ncbi:MAG TPA: fucose operon FucU protein [Lachnospiraceae bacterium]|nr:fucose operon FucU protein [Lachnospiraceae bacterium]
MLKHIPQILHPELVKVMMEMGHSDTLVIADANFPAYSKGKNILLLPGTETVELLEGILSLFPLDTFISHPVKLMRNLDTEPVPGIWKTYRELLEKYDEEKVFQEFGYLDRMAFYEEARKACLIVQTATTARYANIILQKGVI